jgi:5,10-methylene-tetrahydrofolate dehydrogenase/methenyl tetrahydrofolate cyclohydrolase
MTERGRYRAMPDGLTTGSKASVTDLGCKDLKEGDRVGDVAQRGIQAEGSAEAGPNVPGFIAPITVVSSDAGSGCCL